MSVNSANRPGEPLQILVQLRIRDSAALQEFETAAVRIMAKYNGRLLSAFETAAAEGELAVEVHLLEFPDHESFAAYREDPELLELAALRARAISHSEVLLSNKLKHYA